MIVLCDAIAGLCSLEESSARLILSDLPSGETRAEFDKAPDFSALWPAVWRALAPDGNAVFMCSSLRFAAAAAASSPHYSHDLVWSKSLATGHLNAKHTPLRAHEFILVFRKGPGVYNPQMMPTGSPIHKARRRAHGENYGPMTASTESRAGATDRYPVSVLEFSSVGTSDSARVHPQQKPVPLLAWLVRTYSNAGDLVVDPYAGSGSTGVAAELEGRRFRGFDSSPRFATPIWDTP